MIRPICTTIDDELKTWAKNHKISIAELIRQGRKHHEICEEQGSKIVKLTEKLQEFAIQNDQLKRRIDRIQQEKWGLFGTKPAT